MIEKFINTTRVQIAHTNNHNMVYIVLVSLYSFHEKNSISGGIKFHGEISSSPFHIEKENTFL